MQEEKKNMDPNHKQIKENMVFFDGLRCEFEFEWVCKQVGSSLINGSLWGAHVQRIPINFPVFIEFNAWNEFIKNEKLSTEFSFRRLR